MANDFYTHSGYPATGSFGSSSSLRSELDAIQTGFDKLPGLTGNGGRFVAVNSGGTGLAVVSTLSVDISGNVTFTGNASAAAFIPTGATVPTNGMYLSGTNKISIGLNGLQSTQFSNSAIELFMQTSPASVIAYSGTDSANSHFLRFRVDATTARLETGKNGTGVQRNLDVYTAGVNVASFLTTGGLTINAPTSGPVLTAIGTTYFQGAAAAGTVLTVTPDPTSGGNGVALAASFATGGYGPINFQTTATTRLTIAAAGNVTLNAPSSGDTLTLNVLAGGHNAWSASDGTVSTQCFLNGATGVVIGVGTNHPLNITTNNTARIAVAAAGNVTVNAPSSGTGLTVAGGGASITGSQVDVRAPAGTEGGQINLFNAANTTAQWTIDDGPSDAFRVFNNVSGGMVLQALTSGAVTLGGGTGGNVTINAPATGFPLTVNGGTGTGGITTSTNVASIYTGLQITNTNAGAGAYAAMFMTANGLSKQFRVNTGGGYEIVNNANSVVLFSLADNGAITTASTASGAIATFTGNQASAVVVAQNTGTSFAGFSTQSAASQTSYMFFNTTGFGETARLQAGASGSLDLCTNTAAAVRLSISPVGAVTINAPSSGSTLTLGAPAAATSLVVNNTAGNTAIATSDGTCQTAIYTNGAAGALFSVPTNHPLSIRTNNTARIDIAAAGEVTLNPSTGGNKHLVNQQGGSFAIGYLNLPQSTSTLAATTDVGKSIVATSTITIPNSTFAAGDCFTIYNNSAAAITLTCNTTTTRIAGTATTGTTRTLAQRGQCTAYFLSATELILSGNVT